MIQFLLLVALEQAKKSIMLYSTFSFFFPADVVECGQHRDQVSIRKAAHRLGNYDTSQARQRVVAVFCRGHHLQRATYPEKFSQGTRFG